MSGYTFYVRKLTSTFVWFWGVCLVLAAAATVVLARIAAGNEESMGVSVTGLLAYGGLWYPFVIGIIAASLLTAHVASGRTRASFLRGALIGAGVIGVSFGLTMIAALVAEREIFQARGWTWRSISDEALLGTLTTNLAAYPVSFTAAGVCGLLVGLSFYRWRAWATLALPLTLLPLFASSIPAGRILDGEPFLQPLPTLIGGLAAIAIGAVAAYLIGRSTPVGAGMTIS